MISATVNYDGKWGREIREQAKRERNPLSVKRLTELRALAIQAQVVVPGPWMVSEANFIICDAINGDPETGRAVAEVDCYNEHTDIKAAYLAAFDPDTCLRLLELATQAS